jgi:PKD repeat protein
MLFWTGGLFAQVNSEDNVILVSGQIVNNVNGAPISSHKIYIESDSLTNNGFNYYSTIYTDVNGFFFDTVNTTNNSGYIDIFLYDFNENLVEASKYYRFNWEDEYQMVANFQIFDPNANQTTQANFKSEEIPENELKIHFKDHSSGFVIKAWSWDFGDGNFSEIQDPIHEYEEPGIYYVTLTISSKPLEFEYVNVSKITKRVMVGLPDYYSLGGHVYAPPFPIDFGLAYLYKLDQNKNPVAVDTAAIDTLGYYYFYAVIEGDYIVKARLTDQSVKYGEYIPTYFGYSYDWEEADIIEHDGEHFNHHVYLIKSDGTKYGDGEISGQITYDTNTITTTYSPAEDIEIILMDGTNICLTCRLSDLEGNFSFSNLRHGTYQIFPEVTGVRNHPMYITISDETPGNSNVSLVIQPQQIMFSIAEPQSEIYEGDIVFSPNPFQGRGELSLNLAESSAIEIYIADARGSVVLHQSAQLSRGNHTIPVDLNNQPSGMYHLMIQAGDGSVSALKLLKQ